MSEKNEEPQKKMDETSHTADGDSGDSPNTKDASQKETDVIEQKKNKSEYIFQNGHFNRVI